MIVETRDEMNEKAFTSGVTSARGKEIAKSVVVYCSLKSMVLESSNRLLE